MHFIVPDKVENILARCITSTSLSVVWLPVNGTAEVNYDVTWSSIFGSGFTTTKSVAAAFIGALLSNTEYTVHVQARNSGGSGPKSEETKIVTCK